VQRAAQPVYSLILLNRLSPVNFVLPLAAGDQVVAPQQYMMIRGVSSVRSECSICSLLLVLLFARLDSRNVACWLRGSETRHFLLVP